MKKLIPLLILGAVLLVRVAAAQQAPAASVGGLVGTWTLASTEEASGRLYGSRES